MDFRQNYARKKNLYSPKNQFVTNRVKHRAETQPISNNSPIKDRKFIQSSVFLPSLKQKSHVSYHTPLNSNRRDRYRNNYNSNNDIISQDSDYQTEQYLNQCQKILTNLKKLTQLSHNRIRKQRKSYSLQVQQKTPRRNQIQHHHRICDQEILHIQQPTKYANQHKKTKQRYAKYASNDKIIEKKSEEMQAFETIKINKTPYQKQSKSVSKQYYKAEIDENDNYNEFSFKNRKMSQQEQFQEPKNREKKDPEKKDREKKKTLKKEQEQQLQQQGKNAEKLAQKVQEISQSEKIINQNFKRQKTLLKYLTMAKKRGSTLNQKISSHYLHKPATNGSNKKKSHEQNPST